MSNIEIKRVNGRKELKEFVRFRNDLYRDSEYAVPFLYSDEMATLDEKRNASFECCQAIYYMAYRDGKPVGRIAGIINERANDTWKSKTVRFGWFDFVDDIEVSRRLLDAVETWGRSKGMEIMAGPLGFTDMDREGMLIEGFDRLATMYVNYNYPYYAEHMEQLGGFEKDNDYKEYLIKVPEKVPEKFGKLSAMIEQRYKLHVHKLTRRELQKEGYGHKIFDLLNITYKDLYGFSQLSERQINQLVDSYIRLADLNLISVVEDESNPGQPVGFGVTFPSFSQALRKCQGKLWPTGWWEMLKVALWHRTEVVDLLLIGVLPKYRSKGVNALIFNDIIQQCQRYGFKYAEAMVQMETNEAVQSQWQYLESIQHKRHRCYKKQLIQE
uniref:N-acetyltransferase n=1 Tax=Prevotella sp. GTC17260 TaxID=3236796 RepID=A0AB33JAX4_9BACT